jgi:hypothetical protein
MPSCYSLHESSTQVVQAVLSCCASFSSLRGGPRGCWSRALQGDVVRRCLRKTVKWQRLCSCAGAGRMRADAATCGYLRRRRRQR